MKKILIIILSAFWVYLPIHFTKACALKVNFISSDHLPENDTEIKTTFISIQSIYDELAVFTEFLSVDLLNKKLEKIKFYGIKNVIAHAWLGNERDVLIVITCLENFSIIERIYAFRWYDIITPIIEIDVQEVWQNVLKVKPTTTIVELNFELEKIRLPGIRSMIAQFVNDSKTDVLVIIDTYVGYKMHENKSSFVLENIIIVEKEEDETIVEEVLIGEVVETTEKIWKNLF